MFFIRALRQEIIKNNKISILLDEYKQDYLHMKTATLEQFLAESPKDKEMLISKKIDGELTALVKKGQDVKLYSRSGRIRTDTFLTDEFKKCKYDGIFVGELYVLSKEGGAQTYAKSLSALRAPKDDDEKRYRISLFDIIELNGKKLLKNSYEERLNILKKIIDKKYTFIHIAPTIKGSLKDIKVAWEKWIKKEGWEGLVIRFDNEIYKVKPLFSIDLLVIGVTKNTSHKDQMGALMTAFVLKNNLLLKSSKIGTGFDTEDRKEWLKWAKQNKIEETDKEILINPFKDYRIIEVKAEEFRETEEDLLQFKNNKLEKVGKQKSISLRKPVFLSIRKDKKPVYKELGLDQVPKNLIINGGFNMLIKNAGLTLEQWLNRLKSKGAPDSVIRQFKHIHDSAIERGESEEYAMRAAIDRVPKEYLDEPTKVHGPEKSGPKSKKSFLNIFARKYSPKAQKEIQKILSEKLSKGEKASPQDIAIAINEAREKGYKVPEKKGSFVNLIKLAQFSQVAYIVYMPGHKNSKGESAPWVIKDHNTGKILSSHKSKAKAKKHLRDMHIFKGK